MSKGHCTYWGVGLTACWGVQHLTSREARHSRHCLVAVCSDLPSSAGLLLLQLLLMLCLLLLLMMVVMMRRRLSRV